MNENVQFHQAFRVLNKVFWITLGLNSRRLDPNILLSRKINVFEKSNFLEGLESIVVLQVLLSGSEHLELLNQIKLLVDYMLTAENILGNFAYVLEHLLKLTFTQKDLQTLRKRLAAHDTFSPGSQSFLIACALIIKVRGFLVNNIDSFQELVRRQVSFLAVMLSLKTPVRVLITKTFLFFCKSCQRRS